MTHNRKTIESFHADIVQWQSEGASYRDVAKLLEKRGLKVSFNAVDRYCKKHGIVKREPPQPPAATPMDPPSQAPDDSLFPDQAVPQSKHPKPPKSELRPPRTRVNTHDLQGVHAYEGEAPPATESVSPPVVEQSRKKTPPAPVTPDFESSRNLKSLQLIQTGQEAVPPETPAPSPPPEPPALAPPPQPRPLALAPTPSQTRTPPLTSAPPRPWRDPPKLFMPLPKTSRWSNDLDLLRFGGEGDQWTLQDACEGTFILGASGSGKTTGSGRALAGTFLASDFGGLILTVKPGEAKLWEAYARAAGREEQLCIVRPGGHFKLNFLDYESRRPGKGSGLIENLVSLFYTIIDVSAKGQHNRELSRFWSDVGKELIRNTFRVLTLATSPLKLDEVCRFIIESPQRVYGGNPKPAGPWFTQCMDRAMAAAQGTPQEAVIEKARLHWLDTFYNLAPDTRSCVITAFSSMADVFVEPAINDLFCTQTTIIPENVLDGAIIVIDLPLLSGYEAVGLFAQSIWKYLFQKAIERRDDPDDECRRPAFLWIDEAQHFHSANDCPLPGYRPFGPLRHGLPHAEHLRLLR